MATLYSVFVRRALLLTVLISSSISHATRVANTMVDYYIHKDEITDENKSTIFIREVNDINNSNVVMFKCINKKPTFFLISKNNLLTKDNYSIGILPQMIFRVDGQPPVTVATATVTDGNKPALDAITVFPNDLDAIWNAFSGADKKVAIRIMRSGMSELTFVFLVKGFFQGSAAISFCG